MVGAGGVVGTGGVVGGVVGAAVGAIAGADGGADAGSIAVFSLQVQPLSADAEVGIMEWSSQPSQELTSYATHDDESVQSLSHSSGVFTSAKRL